MVGRGMPAAWARWLTRGGACQPSHGMVQHAVMGCASIGGVGGESREKCRRHSVRFNPLDGFRLECG